jgi:putative DNA-invertase from lambdoid prophage Rac
LVLASERPGFGKLLDKPEARDMLVVTKLDRLGRMPRMPGRPWRP